MFEGVVREACAALAIQIGQLVQLHAENREEKEEEENHNKIMKRVRKRKAK